MAEVTNIKPLVKEDYPKEHQQLIEQLSFSLNPFMRQVVAAFAKQIDFTNLANSIISFDVEVSSSGVPKNATQVKIDPSKRILGCHVVYAQNLTDGGFPSGAPFITFTTNKTILTVGHITGLEADKRYNIRAILVV